MSSLYFAGFNTSWHERWGSGRARGGISTLIFTGKALMWHNHSSPGPARPRPARHNLSVGRLCTASLQMYHRHLTSQQDATTVWVCTVVLVKTYHFKRTPCSFNRKLLSDIHVRDVHFSVELIYFLILKHSCCCPVFCSLSATLLLKLHEQVCKYGLLNPDVNIGPSNTGVFPWYSSGFEFYLGSYLCSEDFIS